MDHIVFDDGGSRRDGMGQGVLPYLGKNRLVLLWFPIIAERALEHCVLRFPGPVCRPFIDPGTAYSVGAYH